MAIVETKRVPAFNIGGDTRNFWWSRCLRTDVDPDRVPNGAVSGGQGKQKIRERIAATYALEALSRGSKLKATTGQILAAATNPFLEAIENTQHLWNS